VRWPGNVVGRKDGASGAKIGLQGADLDAARGNAGAERKRRARRRRFRP